MGVEGGWNGSRSYLRAGSGEGEFPLVETESVSDGSATGY
jgi:hypothetical protein